MKQFLGIICLFVLLTACTAEIPQPPAKNNTQTLNETLQEKPPEQNQTTNPPKAEAKSWYNWELKYPATNLSKYRQIGCRINGDSVSCPFETPCETLNSQEEYNALEKGTTFCWVRDTKRDLPNDYGIRKGGCYLPSKLVFALPNKEGITLITTATEFRKEFTPVDTPQKAMAFAFAFMSIRDETAIPAGANWNLAAGEETPDIPAARVERTEEGFIIHGYLLSTCPCPNQTVFSVDILVTTNGLVEQLKKENVGTYDTGICVD